MADLVIKRKEQDVLLKGKIEIELDGEIKEQDFSLSIIQSMRLNVLSQALNDNNKNVFFDILEYVKKDILGISEDIYVSDDEIFNAFISLSEAAKKEVEKKAKTPRVATSKK